MSKLTNIGTLANETVNILRKRMENPELYRPISLGIPELGEIIGGLVLPSYVAIGGPAKKGKTTVMTAFANEITKPVVDEKGEKNRMIAGPDGTEQELKIAYFHLEETAFQFSVRMLAMGTKTATRTIVRDLRLTAEHFVELEVRASELQVHNIHMTDSVFTADEILKIAREEKAQVIFVDTFNLLDDKNAGSRMDESARLAAISKKFIEARNKEGITTIIAYQLNDTGKQLGTRSAYRDADLILEIDVAKDSNRQTIDGQLAIHVKPSRQAKGGGVVHVAFSGDHNRITPLEKVSSFNSSTIEEQMKKFAESSVIQEKLIQ